MYKRIAIGAVLIALLSTGAWILAATPSNDRDWSVDQALLPQIKIDSDTVTIRNVRNFSYRSTSDYTPAYYDRTYDLNELKRVWFMVEPFSGFGAAHTLLSFEFEGDVYVAVSGEIRKEKGESFAPLPGLFNQYEFMFVIGDENDLIKLRTNYRKDTVYLYPLKATPQEGRALLLSILERAHALETKPEFYNTLTNTCQTSIVSAINESIPVHIPVSWKNVLPEYSDELFYQIGLLDVSGSLEDARVMYRINDRAQEHGEDADFSREIRSEDGENE